MTRNRAGMPDITKEMAKPGNELREAILRERALEFGYEEVRYFDLIRWKREDLIRQPLSRLIVKKVKAKPGFTYTPHQGMFEQRQYLKEGTWSKKYFLLPLPVDEINKKYGLIQNPGWE